MATVTPESLRKLAAQVRAMRKDLIKQSAPPPGEKEDAFLGSLVHESSFFCVWAELAADRLEKAPARAD